jgi:hypothetical protein
MSTLPKRAVTTRFNTAKQDSTQPVLYYIHHGCCATSTSTGFEFLKKLEQAQDTNEISAQRNQDQSWSMQIARIVPLVELAP